MSQKDLISRLDKTFLKHKNGEFAQQMSDYMRGKFSFYGIKMDFRREICKEFFNAAKQLGRDDLLYLSKTLYQRVEREYHHNAVEILDKFLKAQMIEKKDIKFFEWLVCTNSWWDTVDVVAPRLMRLYFDVLPEEKDKKVNEWFSSDNIWLIRSAILIHLKQKEKTDMDFLFSVILRASSTDEFFINKAIGWILRENSKRIPDEIAAFVKKNESKLHPLAIREGMRIVLENK
ncbi:DNA alkylation repair protein [Crocinitomix catalasitica]|nr:DNA alkylation repair protein [Crocinitomix catalasitica]